jgi:hypothetical protein
MGRRVSDGQAVKVTVPISTTIVAGRFYDLDGFVGMAMSDVVTDGVTTSEVVLEVATYEYELDAAQILTSDAFAKGDPVYWDLTNNRFTTTPGTNRFIGRVTVAKDGSNIVWIKREQ